MAQGHGLGSISDASNVILGESHKGLQNVDPQTPDQLPPHPVVSAGWHVPRHLALTSELWPGKSPNWA